MTEDQLNEIRDKVVSGEQNVQDGCDSQDEYGLALNDATLLETQVDDGEADEDVSEIEDQEASIFKSKKTE